MGYRSDVALVMYPNKPEDFHLLKLYVDESLIASIPEWDEDHYEIIETGYESLPKYIKFYWVSIKWYDSFDGVRVFTDAMRNWAELFELDAHEYKFNFEFIRIGDEYEDIENNCSDGFNILGVARQIEFYD